MRLRYLALLGVLFASGCLIPAYSFDPPGAETGNAGNGANAGVGGSSSAGTQGQPAAGESNNNAGGEMAQGPDCQSPQKLCAGKCVDIDDVTYGCTATSCSMAECPAPGDGTLACADGACVVATCSAGSKKCAGKCVKVDDPAFGCGATTCDASACPALSSGMNGVCSGGKCVLGTCGPDTKVCDGKCVPIDRNHGCAAATCDECESVNDCLGFPPGCACIPDDICAGKACGTFRNRCGVEVVCGSACPASAPTCDANGQCVECLKPIDCPYVTTNSCGERTCINNKCGIAYLPATTSCGEDFSCTGNSTLCNHPMVKAGTDYIDSAEVSQAKYGEFVEAMRGQVIDQPAACSWNTSVEPSENYPPDRVVGDVFPVNFVDWCDAYAYCKWAGKRLCGKPGGGGPTPFASFNVPASSAWMRACAGATPKAYPYGDTFVANQCADAEILTSNAWVSSGGLPLCEGGYSGIHDMSGNLAEWEDSCDAADNCRLRGGDFKTFDASGALFRCDVNRVEPRNHASYYVGFRCCSSTP